MFRVPTRSKATHSGSGQSIIEYIFVIVLVAAVIAIALTTLGESREDYTGEPEAAEETVEEVEENE